MNRYEAFGAAGIFSCVLLQGMASGADLPPSPAAPTVVGHLMNKELIGVAGKELLMLTVQYVPGGASLPHRHDAQVFVYVLEGAVTMQVEGQPAVHLRPGDTFYENPTDVHLTSANASPTSPAKILVFIVKDKGAPVSRDVPLKPKS